MIKIILMMHLKHYTHDQDHNDPRIQMDRNQWSSPWYSYCLCSAHCGQRWIIHSALKQHQDFVKYYKWSFRLLIQFYKNVFLPNAVKRLKFNVRWIAPMLKTDDHVCWLYFNQGLHGHTLPSSFWNMRPYMSANLKEPGKKKLRLRINIE